MREAPLLTNFVCLQGYSDVMLEQSNPVFFSCAVFLSLLSLSLSASLSLCLSTHQPLSTYSRVRG